MVVADHPATQVWRNTGSLRLSPGERQERKTTTTRCATKPKRLPGLWPPVRGQRDQEPTKSRCVTHKNQGSAKARTMVQAGRGKGTEGKWSRRRGRKTRTGTAPPPGHVALERRCLPSNHPFSRGDAHNTPENPWRLRGQRVTNPRTPYDGRLAFSGKTQTEATLPWTARDKRTPVLRRLHLIQPKRATLCHPGDSKPLPSFRLRSSMPLLAAQAPSL